MLVYQRVLRLVIFQAINLRIELADLPFLAAYLIKPKGKSNVN